MAGVDSGAGRFRGFRDMGMCIRCRCRRVLEAEAVGYRPSRPGDDAGPRDERDGCRGGTFVQRGSFGSSQAAWAVSSGCRVPSTASPRASKPPLGCGCQTAGAKAGCMDESVVMVQRGSGRRLSHAQDRLCVGSMKGGRREVAMAAGCGG